jgi:hypothetical protein
MTSRLRNSIGVKNSDGSSFQLVIGVGCQKSGTSSIAKFLSLNGLSMPKKELHAFNLRPGLSPLTRNRYLGLLGAKNQNGVFGEFTPDYLHHPTAVWNISQITPDAKIVISVRNPVERAFSAYSHAVGSGEIDQSLRFEDAVELALRGSATGHWIPSLLTKGMYSKGIQRVLDLFPQDNVMVANYDWWRKAENLKSFQEKLVEFCGLPSGNGGPMPHTNRMRYWRGKRKALSIVLLDNTRKFLQHFYQESKEELESLLDQNLDWW